MKVEIFFGKHDDLIVQINKWLSKNDFEIFKILQSEVEVDSFGYGLTITIFYNKAS